MKSTNRSGILPVLLALLANAVIVVRCGGQTPLPNPLPKAAAQEKWDKFNTKYLKRVSFPLTYDGQPSLKARPEKREQIIAVHSRYWRNFAQIDQVRFRYSLHSLHDGKPSNGDWDMDAQVEMRYGYGIEVEGNDAVGKHFKLALKRQGLWQQASDTRDISSLVLSMFGAFRAHPEVCSIFVDAQRDIAREGDPTLTRYDVLIAATTSDMPGRDQIESKYWFNRLTGMLETIEICDPKEKSQYGRYASVRFSYARCDGVYIPTEIVQDFPFKGNRFIEKYNNIKVLKRANLP
jgi:hypothetical protein